MRKIKFLVVFIIFAMVLTACGKDNGEKVRIVLDWVPNTNHAGLYVAQDKGYYKELGIDVEIMQPPDSGAVPLVATGSAQFAISFQEEMGVAIAKSEPFPITAVAAVVNHNTSIIVSPKAENIKSPKDLEGKTFTTWDSPLVHEIVRTIVEADGGDFSKVKYSYNNVTDAVSALQADVEALWVFKGWDGMAIEEAGLEVNYFNFTDYYQTFDYYTPVIVANNDYLKDNPEQARKFMEATAKGYEYAIKNPNEAAEIMIKAVPELNGSMVKRSMEYLSGEYKAEAEKWGYIDNTRWTTFYAWMYENGLLENEITGGYTNEFLP